MSNNKPQRGEKVPTLAQLARAKKYADAMEACEEWDDAEGILQQFLMDATEGINGK